jgi:cytochrome o ubiquinol oxidase subunit 2
MHFEVRALSPEGYAQWIADTRKSGAMLDAAAYAALAKPSSNMGVQSYRTNDRGLFEAIVSPRRNGS